MGADYGNDPMRILPRPFGQVLTDSIGTLGAAWRTLLPAAALAFVPASLLTLFVFSRMGAVELLAEVLNNPGHLQALPEEEAMRAMQVMLGAGLAAILIQGAATLYVFLAANHVVRSAFLAEPVTGREARRHALSRLGPALVVAGLASLAVAGAFTLGLVLWGFVASPSVFSLIMLGVLLTPGVWLSVSFSMLASVLSFERKGVAGSLSRSAELVRGRWSATLWFLVLVGLLGAVAVQLIQLVALPLAAAGANPLIPVVALVGVAAQGMIVAAIGSAYGHWYIDLRSRKEALLADQL